MSYLWRKKRIVFIIILIVFIGIFRDDIGEKIWIFKNKSKVFYSINDGSNKDRIYHDGDKKFGIILDIFNEIENRYGIKIELTEDNSKNNFTALFNQSKDIKEKGYLYTEPYLESRMLFYSKEKLENLKGIQGLKIISDDLTNNIIEDLDIKEFINIRSYNGKLEEFKKEAYDGLILNEEVLRRVGGDKTLREAHEIFLPSIYNTKIGMKISKKDKYLFSIINKTIKELKKSGELDKIIMTNSIKLKKRHIKLTEKEQQWLKAKKIIKIDVIEDKALRDFEKILGNKRNFTATFLNDLFSALGVKVIISNENPDMISSNKMQKGYRYTDPLYSYNLSIYGQNKNKIIELIDLENKKVGVFKDSRGEKYLKENLLKNKLISFKTFKEMADALKKKEINYFVTRDDLVDRFFSKENLKNIYNLGELTKIDRRIGVPNENEELYSIIEKLLVTTEDLKEIELIRSRTYLEPKILEINLKIVVIWILGSLIAIFYIFILIRQIKKKKQEIQKNEALISAIIKVLEKSNKYNDEDTGEHINRVALYSKLLATYYGCSHNFILKIEKLASLHDVGKLGIGDSILKKRGKLTLEEFEEVKKHVTIGYKLIKASQLGSMAENIVRYHHEKWNGKGYMEGLKGEEIPIEARIVALADVYDALRQKRSYKLGFSHEKSISIIKEERGVHFDPALVDLFIKNEEKFDEIYENLK